MQLLNAHLERMKRGSSEHGRSRSRKEHTCDDSPNKNLCLPKSYSKFELPFTDSVNVVEIGIDIIDVLRINDKVSTFQNSQLSYSDNRFKHENWQIWVKGLDNLSILCTELNIENKKWDVEHKYNYQQTRNTSKFELLCNSGKT